MGGLRLKERVGSSHGVAWITLRGSWIQRHRLRGAAVPFPKLEKCPHD